MRKIADFPHLPFEKPLSRPWFWLKRNLFRLKIAWIFFIRKPFYWI